MNVSEETSRTADPAAMALAFVLELLGLPANPAELLHLSGKACLDETDLFAAFRSRRGSSQPTSSV